MLGAILALGSLAIETGKAISEHKAQQKRADANRTSALEARRYERTGLSIRKTQERRAAGLEVSRQARQANTARGAVKVSALSSGVQGSALDLLIDNISQDQAQARLSVLDNLHINLGDLTRAQEGADLKAQARIRGGPQEPSDLATGLQIGAGALNALSIYRSSKP